MLERERADLQKSVERERTDAQSAVSQLRQQSRKELREALRRVTASHEIERLIVELGHSRDAIEARADKDGEIAAGASSSWSSS